MIRDLSQEASGDAPRTRRRSGSKRKRAPGADTSTGD